ncbi:MAG TPA: hypothetical protein VGG43_11315 [Acidimicrobiales bacterium]
MSSIIRRVLVGVVSTTAVVGLGIAIGSGATTSAGAAQPSGGYYEVATDGGVFAFGTATFFGSMGGRPLNKPIVGMAATPDGKGYWLVAQDGGIFAFGDAGFYGSTGSLTLNNPIVGMAATPNGAGYYLVASDGGIFAFGNARFMGSTGGLTLNKPVVGMALTEDGGGYWLVGQDRGIFNFGDAPFDGSGLCITQCSPGPPAVGIAANFSSIGGYWITQSDGETGYFPNNMADFQKGFFGPGAPIPGLVQPVVGVTALKNGMGYWLVAGDGGIFSIGSAPFYGSIGGHPLNAPVVGMASTQ